MSYAILNGAVLIAVWLGTAFYAARINRNPNRRSNPSPNRTVNRRNTVLALAITAAVLIALTAIFDHVLVAGGIVDYDRNNLLGLHIGASPIEDFAYTLAAVALIPALWVALRPGAPLRRVGGGLLLASRPYSWINTAYPFAAGYLLTARELDAPFWLGTVFFLIPYNLIMYGINDVFDRDSDLHNPRKGGIEGAAPDAVAPSTIVIAASAVGVPFTAALLLISPGAAAVVLVALLIAVVGYSIPGLRLKERAGWDSLVSSIHFVGPLVFALVLTGTSLTQVTVWPILVAFTLWGMASHAFGAVQDIGADRLAQIGSIAVTLGARTTVRLAVLGYLAAAGVLLFLPGPAALSAVLPLCYAVSVARFWSITDDAAHQANRGWRTFLWLNMPVGAVVTMALILAAR